MMPINRYMDYPETFQGTHFPYPYHYYPSWIPPQTKVETTTSCGMFEPWFYGSSYGFPNPAEYHGCCNHGQPFGYYNCKPPHSHLPPPPPPPFYHHGPYSLYDLHPPHYFPPHFSMEQPRYEIDKTMPKNHCCGCPNHTCNGKEEKGVKIEEHDPEVEKKESDPLSLTQVKNHPHPILWVPPEYMRNRAASKPFESDQKLLNSWFPLDMKNDKESSKGSDSEPKVWNGWSPFDVNSIRSLGQDRHKDRTQNQQNEEREGQMPHPIIWMPVYDKPEDVEKTDPKESNVDSKGLEKPKKKYTIIPVRFPYNVDSGAENGAVKDTSKTGVLSKVRENEVEDKRILVRHMEEGGERKTLEYEEKNLGNSVKRPEEHGDKKPDSNEKTKRRSASPTKAKLSPVCLRVDPLPRRKSRSTSPPSLEEKVVKEVDGTSKSSSPQEKKNSTAQAPVCNIEVKPQKKERKVVEAEERMLDQGKRQDSRNCDQVQVPVVIINKEVSGETTTERAEMKGDRNEVEEGAKEERKKKEMTETNNLSSAEAAVRIQSAYRGYEVRKWEPLKKLRRIARVRQQVDEIRNQILGLEASDVQKNEKQRVLIGETIMNLLLQLDTIQGFHPSVREIRKSVARELVCLQENLDSLTSQRTEGLTSAEAGEEPNVKPAEAGVETNVKPTVEDNGEQAGSIEESQDSEPEKNLSVGTDDSCVHLAEIISKPEESEHQLLDVPGSRIKEVVPMVSEAPADFNTQSTATIIDKESLPLGDDCVELLTCANMNNKVRGGDGHYESEVMLEAQKANEDLEFPKEHVGNVLVALDNSGLVPNELLALPVGQEGDDNSDIDDGPVLVQVVDLSPVSKASEHEFTDIATEVLDKDSASSDMEEIEKCKSGKSNEPASNEAEQKLEESMLPLVQEKNRKEETEEVFKPEEQLVKEKNIIEEPTEIPKICDADALNDVKSLSAESVDTGAGMEVMEVADRTKEDKTEKFAAAKNEVPKVDEMITGDMDNPAKDISEALEEAIADKDKAVDCCFSRTEDVEAKVMDVAPESALGVKDEGDSSLDGDVNVRRRSLEEFEEKNDLVKENEKLRVMLEKFIRAGNDQLTVISNLNARVKDLERKLTSRKRELKMRHQRAGAARPRRSVKPDYRNAVGYAS